MRLWGGRFSGETDARVADFTRSIEIDAALAADDIAGSIAHVHGLGRAGILRDEDVEELVAGLRRLPNLVEAGCSTGTGTRRRPPEPRGGAGRQVGPLAGQLHTGRSRNDQVATDLRLWMRWALDDLDAPARLRTGACRRSPSATARPSFRGRPTSSPRSRSCSRITCWPTSRWPSAIAAFADARRAPTSRRSGRGPWRAPASRSIARRPPPSSDSMASARTRSTRSRTATSWSRHSRRSRSGWST